MVLKADRERVKTLLKDTITLLCKNGLEFKSKFSLEALIGVTLDEGDVMLISINEMVKSDSYRSSEPSDGEGNAGGSPRRKKRKRTHKRRVKTTDEFVVSGDEANTDSDGSSNSGAEPLEPVEKKPCEDPNACDDKSGGDLVFVKQEVPDGWDSGSVSHNLPSTSVGNQGQDNFAALPDIGLTEIDGGEGASWMLSAQEQSDIAQLSGSQNNLGTSALTSSQDGAQMFDQQQSQYHVSDVIGFENGGFGKLSKRKLKNSGLSSQRYVSFHEERQKISLPSDPLERDRLLIETLLQIKNVQDNHSFSLNKITEHLSTSNTSSTNVDDFHLPLTCHEDVSKVEELLKDKKQREALVNHLTILGGFSTKETVNRIMRELMTTPVARLYNWSGKPPKVGLSKLQLAAVILEAGKRNKITQAAMEVAIRRWLQNSNDRDGGRKARADKKKERDAQTNQYSGSSDNDI